MEPKQFEQIVKATSEMKEALLATDRGVAETKEMQKKMEADLTEKLGLVSNGVDELTAKFETLTKKQEEAENDIYKQILYGASKETMKVAKQWGYNSNPISKKLYTPSTYFVHGKGYVQNKAKQEIDPALYKMNDFLYLYGLQKAKHSTDNGNPMSIGDAVKDLETYKFFMSEMKNDNEIRRALASTNTGNGAEWVPTQMSSQLIDELRLALKVANMFRTLTMPAGNGAWDLPYNPSRNTAYLVGQSTKNESTKIPAGEISTADFTVTAVKHAIRLLFSYEMDEDSAIAIMPLVMDNLRDALARAQEYAIMNGDTDTTHMDSDVTSAWDAQKSWNGLRKDAGIGGSTGTVDISTLNITAVRNVRKGMGVYGADSMQLKYFVSVAAYIKLLGLTEVLTVDKFGNDATIRTGALAMVDGSEVHISPAVRQDLNATGVFDGVTTSKTEIVAAHTGSYANFEKPSGILIENAKDIETQQNVAVASRRVTFKLLQNPTGDNKTANIGYNLAS